MEEKSLYAAFGRMGDGSPLITLSKQSDYWRGKMKWYENSFALLR
jgi:hypothetical protein